MALVPSVAAIKGLANTTGLKEQFDDGFLFLYAGPVPATADEALDLVSAHTEIVMISESDDGVTGLTFEVNATTGALGKTAAETWSGTAAFDGFEDTETDLTPTFYRFCAAGDDGRAVANTTTGYRIQGTVGGVNSGADLQLGATQISNTALQPIGAFGWIVGG